MSRCCSQVARGVAPADASPYVSCSERKRRQLTELQARVSKLEANNMSLTKLLQQRDAELAMLRDGAHARAPH